MLLSVRSRRLEAASTAILQFESSSLCLASCLLSTSSHSPVVSGTSGLNSRVSSKLSGLTDNLFSRLHILNTRNTLSMHRNASSSNNILISWPSSLLALPPPDVTVLMLVKAATSCLLNTVELLTTPTWPAPEPPAVLKLPSLAEVLR